MKTQLKCALVGLVTAIVMSSAGPSRAGTWTRKADMPTARFAHTSVVDGKIYAIGALQGSGRTTKVEAYDPATDTWAAKADMPTTRTFIATSVVDGKIYVIGGSSSWGGASLTTVEAYDPVTDTWTKKADMPAVRGACGTGVVNGKIYAIGGYRGPNVVSAVEEYDPVTDTWTKKADMPTARGLLSIIVVNGKIYAIGGQTHSTFAAFSTVEVYDPVTDTWTRKADMPVRRVFPTCLLGDKIYGFGGRSARGGATLSTVFEFNTTTDTWADIGDLPVKITGAGVSTVGRRIYVIGGSSAPWPYSSVLSTVWEFIPSPEFDFNEDGIVDAEDMTIMVDHWHTDAPRYDLAPAPAGDGIVDVQDLIALSEHLFEDERIIAHWKLDETDGDVAYDSGATHDAAVIGNALWQPENGQVRGALQFDGIDNYIFTPLALNPAEGGFSAFAWIKGGAPGQVILSQLGSADWLAIGAQGTLKSTLKGFRRVEELTSMTVITDDDWHRVGFTWDGASRVLYVDDSEVARVTHMGLQSSQGELTIGAGKNLAPGTFWSGMIDDVLIYNRAVAP